jgi:tetratricopeptide (TPR) repeat protein
MNPNLERALLLYQQSRHELAENELRQALASDPQDAFAHALLGLCLAAREKFDDATAEVRQAIHLAPDFSFAHYAHARVLYDRNHHAEARAAIEEAIRLDSTDADYFSLLASIHFDERRWPETLAASEQGLQFDSEHIGCTNLRAMAMVKLGRKAEAGTTIDAALARNPNNAITHANQGWTLLEKSDPKKALEHFREALRLDPENEWARHGIVEALKAHNVIYALMLKYFLWMSRFPPGVQWGIVLGGYFGNRLLSGLAASNPRLAPWLLPLRVVYVAFALMTWLADPLFNLLLRLNPFGRLVLSREETVASNWFGSSLLLALLALAGCAAFGFDLEQPWLPALMVFGFLLLPLSATFKCRAGWPRKAMAGYTIAMAGIGIMAIGLQTLGVLGIPHGKLVGLGGMGLLLVFLFGAIGSPWVANILIAMRPKR